MPVELLTLIALWCGNPVAYHATIVPEAEVRVADVKQCRLELRECMKQQIDKNSPMIAQEAFNIAADVCTAQVSQPGTDK
jgi:hypothetical protein